MAETDESLLRSFAATRDGDAFRTLAGRYLGLIFHTALRRTGNRQLAEEASQNALCALAKKAGSLAAHPERLPAWLHRAAVFESSKAMRMESSHQRRKQLRHPDQIDGTGGPDASPWSEAVPHLDVALDRLSEADRRILLLHYYENRSYPQIAQAFGKSQAAVEKRSQRALQKLSRLLRAKGVALSATSIGAGISAEMAKAAPLSLLAGAVAPALSASVAGGTGLFPSLWLLMNSKTFLPLVLLLCAVPLGLQQLAISRVARENEGLRRGGTSAVAPPRPRPPSAAAARTGLPADGEIHALLEECDRASLTGLSEEFQRKLNGYSEEVLVRLVREGVGVRAHSDRKYALLDHLLNALGSHNPELAVKTAVGACQNRAGVETLVQETRVERHLVQWAKQDPDAALAWYRETVGLARFAGPSSGKWGFSGAGQFLPYLTAALAAVDHPQLSDVFAEMDGAERMKIWNGVGRDLLLDVGGAYGVEERNEDHLRMLANYLHLIRQYSDDGKELESWVRSIAGTFGSLHPSASPFAAVTEFLRQADATAEEAEMIAREAARNHWLMRRTPFDLGWERQRDAEVADFLKSALPEQADAVLAELAGQVARQRFQHAAQVLERLRLNPSISDQQLADQLIQNDFRSHIEEAAEQAARIQDPGLRESTLNTLRSR